MTETAEEATPEPAAVTLAEATTTLTAEGQLFEMDQLEIRGIPTRIWKNAPATLRTVLELSAAHGDEEREVVALRYGGELSAKEMAKLLGERETTVEGRLYRALRKLREELEP